MLSDMAAMMIRLRRHNHYSFHNHPNYYYCCYNGHNSNLDNYRHLSSSVIRSMKNSYSTTPTQQWKNKDRLMASSLLLCRAARPQQQRLLPCRRLTVIRQYSSYSLYPRHHLRLRESTITTTPGIPVPKNIILNTTSITSSVIVRALSTTMISSPIYERILFARRNNHFFINNNENTTAPTTTILSISPAIVVDDDGVASSSSYIRKVVNWIQRFLNKCHHYAFLSIRGTEIVLRMSPLLLLTPASIIAEQWMGATSNGTNAEKEFQPLQRFKTIKAIDPHEKNQNSHSSTISSYTYDIISNNGMMTTNNAISNLSWKYFVYQIAALGPAFLKLCQWIATRRDVFPPHVCDRLAHLHDRGTCHAWHYTHRALTDAFGPNYEELGLHIDHDPNDPNSGVIGCGSAAQVYKGTLTIPSSSSKNDNDIDGTMGNNSTVSYPVAVKVLHPRFEKLVQSDLWLVEAVADLLHSIPSDTIKMLNLPRACHNFGTLLLLQSDLRCEAVNLNEFRNNFYNHGKSSNNKQKQEDVENQSSIFFPKPVDDWISKEVLVEQLVENAVPISEYLRDACCNTSTYDATITSAVRKELAIPLLNAFLKMVFLDNFVHCDLHPGNVLVRKFYVKREQSKFASFWNFAKTTTNSFTNNDDVVEGEELMMKDDPTMEMKRQIVFLDAGIAFQLDEEALRNLKDLFRAVVTNEGRAAGRLMVQRAKYERCSSVPGGVEAFSNGIGEIVSEFHDRRKDGLTLGAVRIGSLLMRVLDLCRLHGVEIDPAMASVIISTLVLEGLGRSLEPSLNLIDFALPFVLGRGRI